MINVKILIMVTMLIAALILLPIALMAETKAELQVQIDELKAQIQEIQDKDVPDVDLYIADPQEQIDSLKVTPEIKTTPIHTITPKPETTETTEITDCDEELLKVVQLEGGYKCGYDGYLAIASVVFNQLENGYWGDNLHEVLSRPYNFTVYDYDRDWMLTEECRKACIDATNGKRYFDKDVYYFRTESAYAEMRSKSNYDVVLVKWGIVFMRHAK